MSRWHSLFPISTIAYVQLEESSIRYSELWVERPGNTYFRLMFHMAKKEKKANNKHINKRRENTELEVRHNIHK